MGRAVTFLSFALAVAALAVAAWAVAVAEDGRAPGPDRVVGTLWRCKLRFPDGDEFTVDGTLCEGFKLAGPTGPPSSANVANVLERQLEATVATALGTTYRVIVPDFLLHRAKLGDPWPPP